MPASFWIFLIICIATFVVVVDDHGEAWAEFKESKGATKWWKSVKIFTLWFVAVGSLFGTLVLGWESLRDSKKDAEREERFKNVTNQLGQVESEYSQATNDLAETRLMAVSNSSTNQPITSITATVMFFQIGTNSSTFSSLKQSDVTDNAFSPPLITLKIGSSEKLKTADSMPVRLVCSSCKSSADNGGYTQWLLDFSSSGEAGLVSVFPSNIPLKDANKWDTVDIQSVFLPVGTTIQGGVVVLCLNGSKRWINIPKQNVKGIMDGTLLNSVTIRGFK
jgi:hypothetical protein